MKITKQCDKRLTASEEKFRALAEHSTDSIILTDSKDVSYVNPVTLQMFGLNIKLITDILECIHPDDRKMVEAAIAGQRQNQDFEYRILTKEGKEKWIWSRVFPAVPNNPDDTGLMIVSSDLTEIRKREEKQKIAAKTAEEKYNVLTSLMPDMVIETDTEGRMTFVNLKTIEVLEYGSDFYVQNLHFIELISQEDRARCSDDLNKLIKGDANAFKSIYKAVVKSGSEISVMVHVRKMYANNEFFGLNILMFSPTALEFAEQKAQSIQKNIRFLSDSALKFLTFSSDDDIFIFIGKTLSRFASRSIIVVFSHDHYGDTYNIRYISGIHSYIDDLLRILGKPPEEFSIHLSADFINTYLSGKTLQKLDNLKNLMDNDLFKEKAEQVQELLKVDHFYSMGMLRGNKLYGGLLIAPRFEAEFIDTQTIETFIYQAGIALHRKQIDNELIKAKLVAEEADRLKSAFLANMSHEVRTPLNGILGLAQVMLKWKELTPKIRNNIKMIADSGKLLLSLIEDILDVSKIEAEQLKIKILPFELNTLMEQLYSIFLAHPLYMQKGIDEQRIKLKFDKLKEEDITILSDPKRLKQILINLISNALKFTQEGCVHFGCEITNNEVLFYVKDTGIGMSKDEIKKIFDRFIQVDSTLSRKYSGSGLGLAISKGLVALLGGKIWCESKVGKGSSFYFTVPYHSTNRLAVTNKTTRIKRNIDYDWSNYNVLIVEDDIINFKVVEAMLRRTNINIIHAVNGLEAVEKVCFNPQIDIILMDMHLPEMNGLEATAKILEINSTIPIIAQTANATLDDKDSCIGAGCVDYISKPIDMDILYTKISKYLP